MTCASPPPPRPPPAAALAPGFRFHPTDEEIVGYYLKRKVSGRPLRVDAIAEVDLYREEPWDLPGKSRIRSRDAEWYFFCSLDRKYATRSRTNRATGSGYWKTTGKDRAVWRGGRPIGMKKTLVFHAGRAPRGERTNWVMHEYRLEDEELARTGIPQDALVVCRVFQKRGPGPQNGAQYGAPLDEEEWEDDELPAVKEEDGEGVLVGADCPVLAEMDDDEENKDKGVKVKTSTGLIEPDGQGELDNSPDTDSLGKMHQEQGDGDAMYGSIGKPGQQSDQNLSLMAGHCEATDLNATLVAHNDGYLELNDFAYPVRANCQERVAFPEEIPEDCVNGGITSSQELDNTKQYLNIEDESNVSEQFLLSETGENNYSVQLDDLRFPDTDDCSSGKPADDGFMYPNPPIHFPDAYHGFTSGINSFIDASMANTSVPGFMDELMAYFDATENIQPYDLKFDNEASTSNQPKPVPVVNGEKVEAYLASTQPLETVGNCSVSSSRPNAGEQSTSNTVDVCGEPDAQSDKCWDKALSKRLGSMLDAISPPSAFAAEYPVKHHSAVLSSSVTAGMIHIRGITMLGSEDWFVRKNVGAGFIFSRGMTRNDITGNTAGFERMSKMPGGITVFILRNSFQLLFLSVLFLAASFKIGVYVCSS